MRRALWAALIGLAVTASPAVGADNERLLRDAIALREDWTRAWSPAWPELIVAIIIAVLYAVRASELGPRLPRWRAMCFLGGLVVLTLSAASPIDPIGEEGTFWVHMLQHMLIGDLAALLLVVGATGPVLQPVMRAKWVQSLRRLTHPVAAFVIWATLFLGWHIPVFYEAALENSLLHAAEHVSFLTAGVLLWSPIFESLPGPEWFGTGAKLGYMLVVRAIQGIVGNIFLFSPMVFYERYEITAPLWGLSALADQVYAGTVMMGWTGTVTFIIVGALFFRMAREGEMRQALIEGGVDPTAAHRAVRYGRGDVLARRYGIELPSRR